MPFCHSVHSGKPALALSLRLQSTQVPLGIAENWRPLRIGSF
jgi:hypothetical protein